MSLDKYSKVDFKNPEDMKNKLKEIKDVIFRIEDKYSPKKNSREEAIIE